MNTATRNITAATNERAPTIERVAAAAHEAIDGAAGRAELVEQQLREKAAQAVEKLDGAQSAASEQVERSIKRLETLVRQRPVAAAGIAFAAGVLATVMLRR
jgi:ElaB/YqjD/DUF883 family membrane-anchored ribosome-binding protein